MNNEIFCLSVVQSLATAMAYLKSFQVHRPPPDGGHSRATENNPGFQGHRCCGFQSSEASSMALSAWAQVPMISKFQAGGKEAPPAPQPPGEAR